MLIKLVSCEMLVTDSKYLTELFFVLPEGYITAIGYYQITCLTLLILYCTSLILYEIPKCESLYIHMCGPRWHACMCSVIVMECTYSPHPYRH